MVHLDNRCLNFNLIDRVFNYYVGEHRNTVLEPLPGLILENGYCQGSFLISSAGISLQLEGSSIDRNSNTIKYLLIDSDGGVLTYFHVTRVLLSTLESSGLVFGEVFDVVL